MNYRVEIFASNDHKALQRHFNTWLRYERPERIQDIRMVADGAEFTYCVMVLYLMRREQTEK